MSYFPVFMNLDGQRVLVVGGGTVAERKIGHLLKARARVDVVAGRLSRQLEDLAGQGLVNHLSRQYERRQLQGMRLVFAATDDTGLNRRVYRDAETLGVPVNVVDDAAHCRFLSPAVIDRSPVQVAVCTAGASPVLARLLRARIERLLPAGLGRVARALGAVRAESKRRMPVEDRRRFWEALLDWNRLLRWSARPEAAIRRELQAALGRSDVAEQRGMVYLVGAGPGNADLLTLRAVSVLGRADVVLYDRLVSDEVLERARRDARRIYVGKTAGRDRFRQEEIHRLMIDQARAGRTVVRLKGGDPFVFGRGGEELQVLHEAGIACEVVPGITAALACAAYAGIPLTHREHAGVVSFVTGHAAAGKDDDASVPDWRTLAGEGRTLVVYMGIGQAAAIRSGLLQAGISPELPVALVEDGSRESQRVLQGTVGCIPALAAQARKGRPGLLLIGQVAALGSTLGWFQQLYKIKNAA